MIANEKEVIVVLQSFERFDERFGRIDSIAFTFSMIFGFAILAFQGVLINGNYLTCVACSTAIKLIWNHL